jgi:hypothetical protein
VVSIVVIKIIAKRRSVKMAEDSNGGNGSPTVEDGYQWLKTRAANALTRLQSIEVSDTSAVVPDDLYFHPIYRTFQQGVVQCLLSALDHLRFLAWSLENRETPYPYAQATLIRTAITAASTALWMASGNTATERRCRALEFNFNDLKSNLGWLNTLAADPKNQPFPPADQATFDAQCIEIDRRLDWIVQEATTLLAPANPFTRRTYANQTTSDTQIVRTAGSSVTVLGTGGFDSGLVLSNTWQLLSGYAHARPWASLQGSKHIVKDPTPDPKTGTITVAAQGDPDRLLDFAFRAVIVSEAGVMTLEQLSR